jgi:hypothetical protein
MRRKVFVSMMGGIGDQIFQFGFAYFLKKKLNCDAYLDISHYENKKNYNKFRFRLTNLSKKNKFVIKKNIFKLNYQYISYLRILSKLKLDILFPSIYNLFFKYNFKKFIYEYWKDKKKYKIKQNSYYFGYWHNLKYLKNLKKNINFNLIDIHINKPKIKRFIRSKVNNKTVCLHIRGGDFGSLSSHNLLDQKYYDNSINFYKKMLKNPEFHVFTNDFIFSKKILSKHSRNFKFKYVKDLKLSDIEEFCLFSTYKFSIIANSTFSLISSFLSNRRSVNIAPKVWLKGKKLDKNKKFAKLKFI